MLSVVEKGFETGYLSSKSSKMLAETITKSNHGISAKLIVRRGYMPNKGHWCNVKKV